MSNPSLARAARARGVLQVPIGGFESARDDEDEDDVRVVSSFGSRARDAQRCAS